MNEIQSKTYGKDFEDLVTEVHLRLVCSDREALIENPQGSLVALITNVAAEWSSYPESLIAREILCLAECGRSDSACADAGLPSDEEIATRLLTLPQDEREALKMRYFDGLSYRQIAERTGAPEQAVKKRLAKGYLRLRLALEATPKTPRGDA